MPLLPDQYKQNLHQVFCDTTAWRVLHRPGYVCKRPRYVLAADPQREKKRHIRYVLGNLQRRSVMLVEDETDLLLFPPLRSNGLARARLHLNWKVAAYNLQRLVYLKEAGVEAF